MNMGGNVAPLARTLTFGEPNDKRIPARIIGEPAMEGAPDGPWKGSHGGHGECTEITERTAPNRAEGTSGSPP